MICLVWSNFKIKKGSTSNKLNKLHLNCVDRFCSYPLILTNLNKKTPGFILPNLQNGCYKNIYIMDV